MSGIDKFEMGRSGESGACGSCGDGLLVGGMVGGEDGDGGSFSVVSFGTG